MSLDPGKLLGQSVGRLGSSPVCTPFLECRGRVRTNPLHDACPLFCQTLSPQVLCLEHFTPPPARAPPSHRGCLRLGFRPSWLRGWFWVTISQNCSQGTCFPPSPFLVAPPSFLCEARVRPPAKLPLVPQFPTRQLLRAQESVQGNKALPHCPLLLCPCPVFRVVERRTLVGGQETFHFPKCSQEHPSASCLSGSEKSQPGPRMPVSVAGLGTQQKQCVCTCASLLSPPNRDAQGATNFGDWLWHQLVSAWPGHREVFQAGEWGSIKNVGGGLEQ